MLKVSAISDLHQALAEMPRPLGFVPTMGYLHQGHLSLVQQAKRECPAVAVSIFVNPTQFSPDEDLDNYPSNLERDCALLESEGVDLVWIPTPDMMYPDGFQTWVEVEGLTTLLEGQFRPTHFRGVTTIVAKLFNAVQPQIAYFGQKDAQQAAVIQQMVRDLNYPLHVRVCPIIREPDGLAMSSRNTYLKPDERLAAASLSRGLFRARDAFLDGLRDPAALVKLVEKEIKSEKLARIQYISCADPITLKELSEPAGECLISLAVYVGQTRLIDNVLLKEVESS